jgi:protein gp37
MAQKSKIEWTDDTWNPIVGCSIVSPGCTNCYAMRDAWRKNHNPLTPQYHGLTKMVNGNPVWTGQVRLVEHKLSEPTKRRKPTMYFVNSMGDLFHKDAPAEWIDRCFDVMEDADRHIFQVLTKRSAIMRAYVERRYSRRLLALADDLVDVGYRRLAPRAAATTPAPATAPGVLVAAALVALVAATTPGAAVVAVGHSPLPFSLFIWGLDFKV